MLHSELGNNADLLRTAQITQRAAIPQRPMPVIWSRRGVRLIREGPVYCDPKPRSEIVRASQRLRSTAQPNQPTLDPLATT
jgi:hypothetical protein